jgi:hydrogenase maturation protein HypF
LQTQRLHIQIQGLVQGVGFRPFIYRLARDLGLMGWVSNSAQGVAIEIEGSQSALNLFLLRLEQEQPPRSHIQHRNSTVLKPIGYSDFTIRERADGKKTAIVLPDIATCPDCLQELFDPTNRRYQYPLVSLHQLYLLRTSLQHYSSVALRSPQHYNASVCGNEFTV